MCGDSPLERGRHVLRQGHSESTLTTKSLLKHHRSSIQWIASVCHPSIPPSFLPSRALWLAAEGEACVERAAFEELRRRVVLPAWLEDPEVRPSAQRIPGLRFRAAFKHMPGTSLRCRLHSRKFPRRDLGFRVSCKQTPRESIGGPVECNLCNAEACVAAFLARDIQLMRSVCVE